MGEGFESDIYFTEYTLKKSKGILNIEDAEQFTKSFYSFMVIVFDLLIYRLALQYIWFR